jgi:hypothetical protein
VQEAIRVLSLRLPKVVGSGAVAPSQLLQSRGSGSNPTADSVVQQVLQRMFPQAAPPSASQQPAAPMMPTPPSAPSMPFSAPPPVSPFTPPPPPSPPPSGGIDGGGLPPASIAEPAPPVPFTPPPQEAAAPRPQTPERRAEPEVPDFWRRFPHIIVGPNPNEPSFPPPQPDMPWFPMPREVPLTGGIPDWLRFGPNFGGGGGGGSDDGGMPPLF